MPNWQSNYIETNDLTLHYTRTGDAASKPKPSLILCHGFSDAGLCWSPVAEILQANYDVIMLDARGHGRSEDPEEGYGSLEHAADVAGVIRGLGLEKPIILGHSMGAATALAVAGTYPDLPGAILLEDPPPFWMPERASSPSATRGRFWDRIIMLKRKTKEEMIEYQRASAPAWSDAELDPWSDAKQRLSFRVLTAEQRQPVDWPQTVSQITCPALLITADPDLGAIVAPDQAETLAEHVPGLQTVHIADAGHNVRREQFGAYMDAVQQYLAAL